MKISKSKFEIALARACKNVRQLRGEVSQTSIARAIEGRDIMPATAGRLARALGVDVAEIIETEKED